MKKSTYGVICVLVALSLGLTIVFHDSQVLYTLGTIVFVLIGIVVNVFVIVYFTRNWRANPYGRALMYSKISLAIIVDLSLVTLFLGPDWEGRNAVRLVCLGFILVTQSRLLYLLFSVKHEPLEDESKKRRVK